MCAVARIRTERKQNDKKSCLTLLYLRSCASGTNVIGPLPRTPCSPLSMVLHLRRQQRGMETLLWSTVVIRRKTLQQKAKWTQASIAHHDSCKPFNALKCTLGNVKAHGGKHHLANSHIHPSGISQLRQSDQPELKTLGGHSTSVPRQSYKRVEGLK